MSNPPWDEFLNQGVAQALTKSKAEAFLRRVAQRVRELPLGFVPRWVAGADAAYGGSLAAGAAVVWDLQEGRVVWQDVITRPVPAAYQPGLFFLREAPLVLPLLAKVPFALWVGLVHGHGVAHPLRAGLASVVGVCLGQPAVGCADSLLCGEGEEPGAARGSWSPVWWQGRQVGAWVRTRTGVKPVMVSVGHGICLQEAIHLVIAASLYRLPQPLREADQLARRALRTAILHGPERFAPS